MDVEEAKEAKMHLRYCATGECSRPAGEDLCQMIKLWNWLDRRQVFYEED